MRASSFVAIACLWQAPLIGSEFYKDVLPILKARCQSCHRPGEIGPMPLTTYAEVRPWAAAIRESVKLRKMPPWFADPRYGEFANDARLSDEEIRQIEVWSRTGAKSGTKPIAPSKSKKPFEANLVIDVPGKFRIAPNAVVDYQFVALALPFQSDQWVSGVEIRPSDRSVVHHAVLYIREPDSQWLRDGGNSRDTKADILAIYTPGAPASVFPEGMAKKIGAGSDLVLQMHYTSRKTPAVVTTRIGLALPSSPPRKRLLTLQMGRDDLRIPPGEKAYQAAVSGTVPQDALLISLFPHMHLRGAEFTFDRLGKNGQMETLLKVKPYDFNWQLNYVLKTPRLLRKGDILRWTGIFDNSANNPANPDPTREVTWGEQSWEEMMIGFFDVAVDPEIGKSAYFVR